MTAAEVSKLLGRTLTANETANFALYLNIAQTQLEDWLCFPLCCDNDDRTFDAREGYQTVFTGPFTEVTEVTLNGTVVAPTEYKVKQNDSYSGSWFNSIVFNNRLRDDVIVVKAEWGFGNKLPVDLQALLAATFDLYSRKQANASDSNIKSKEVEDFKITYKEGTSENLASDFVADNSGTIDKYSLCNIGNIQHGDGIRRFYL